MLSRRWKAAIIIYWEAFMKKTVMIILYSLLLIVLIGCQSDGTKENMQPESLYDADKSIDLFVYEDIAYVNAKEVDWVIELVLERGTLIGTIKNTGATSNFSDWDATVLNVGCNIYKSNRSDILLVENNGEFIPYLKYIEG